MAASLAKQRAPSFLRTSEERVRQLDPTEECTTVSEANELDQTQTTQAVEVTLSANSVLVLEIPHALPGEAVERMRHHLRELLDKPGCQVLVLSDGITCKVLQRQAAEDTL